MTIRQYYLVTALLVLVVEGCAFGPEMYFTAIAVSKLGPGDVERLDTETRSGKGLFGPPFSKVYLRTRADVAETVRVYRKGLRDQGWKEHSRLSGSLECWYCTPECRQGRECHMAFSSQRKVAVVGVHVFAERDWTWPEKLKSRYDDRDKYTWVIVF